jgi:hypothetical protein
MSERRTAAKLIRFHPDELARITERARACGRTPARFIRETALGAIPKPRHHAATGALLYELARIGRSLDELARLADASQHAALAERARGALDGHWALVRQVVDHRQRGASSLLAGATVKRVADDGLTLRAVNTGASTSPRPGGWW